MKSRLIKNLLLSSATAAMTFTAPLTAAAEWKQDTNGWRNETGDSTSKGWNQIDGIWYYFDQNGYMQTGWIKYGENWYFTSSTGAMQTGVIEVDGEVYYLVDNGVMQTGDVTINNRTYHFDSSGKNTDASRPPVGKQFNGTNEVPKNKASRSGERGGSGGNSSDAAPPVKDRIDIEAIEPIENGLIKVSLDKPTDAPLPLSAFGIYCPAFGQMTILSVENSSGSEKNRVYILRTPYYKDNTYTLTIDFPDGSSSEADFVIKYGCPSLGEPVIKRTSETTADFYYDSDAEGKFYYILEKQEKGGSAKRAGAPTPEEIISSGVSSEMNVNENMITITGLEKDTPYVVYYVAEDTEGGYTLTHSAFIKSEVEGETGKISILKIVPHFTPSEDIFDSRYWFTFQLSEPTSTPLELSQFSMSCSAGEIGLERVETDDNQNYDVYVEAGSMLKETRFYGKIDFGNGETAENSVFCDLSAPNTVGIPDIVRVSEKKVKLTVDYDEPGTVYYAIFDTVSSDVSVKDPTEIYKNGKSQRISYGTNFIIIESDEIETDKWVCFAAEDKSGNRAANYNYVQIPEYDPDAEIPGENNEYSIIDVSAGRSGNQDYIDVTFNQDVSHMSIDNEYTSITNLEYGKPLFGLENSASDMVRITILNGLKMEPGDHTLFLKVKEEYLTYEFETEDLSREMEITEDMLPESDDMEKPEEAPEQDDTEESEETPEPGETEEPEESPEPEDTEKPEESPEPEDTEKPEESPEPEDTEKPEESPGPEDTEKPEESPEPEDTEKPEESPEPEDTEKPEESPGPEVTEKPEESPGPEVTEKPEENPDAGDTGESEVIPEPDDTEEPEETPEPGNTEETPEPGDTEEPEETPESGDTEKDSELDNTQKPEALLDPDERKEPADTSNTGNTEESEYAHEVEELEKRQELLATGKAMKQKPFFENERVAVYLEW